MHFDPSKTSARAASFAAQRIYHADVSLQDLEVQEWAVPGAYPRAKPDQYFTNFLRQPKRSDGTTPTPVSITRSAIHSKVRLMLARDGESAVTAPLFKKGGRRSPVRRAGSSLKNAPHSARYPALPTIFSSTAIPPPSTIASAASFSSNGTSLSNPLSNSTQELPSTSRRMYPACLSTFLHTTRGVLPGQPRP